MRAAILESFDKRWASHEGPMCIARARDVAWNWGCDVNEPCGRN